MLVNNSVRLYLQNARVVGQRSLRQPAFPSYGKQLLFELRQHRRNRGGGNHQHHHHYETHGIQKQSRTIATNKSLTYSTDKSLDVVSTGESGSNDPYLKDVHIPFPKEIVEYLNKHVIGQNVAKKILAVTVYQHYRRLLYNLELIDEIEATYQSSLPSPPKPKKDEYPAIIGTTIKAAKWNQDFRDFGKKKSVKTVATDLGRKLQLGRKYDVITNPPLLDKTNVCLVGPSGVGKTYLTEKLAHILDVPFALCDCTTLTQSGYVGEDADSVIQKLFQNADGDIERTQRGIVFLDEFDKIATSSDPIHSANGLRDVSGRGVQQALLKIVEGTICRVKNPFLQGAKVDIDTSGILFIASGAFNNLDKVVARRLQERSVGFGSGKSNHDEDLRSKDEQVVAQKRDELLSQAEQSDLIGFGMIPEVVGRFPLVCAFHSLDEAAFVRVLREPKNSLISQAQRQFNIDGIKLEFTDDALAAIASLAVKRKTGARALRSILENILLQAKYECPGTGVEVVVIDKNTVETQGQHFTVIKKSDFENGKLS